MGIIKHKNEILGYRKKMKFDANKNEFLATIQVDFHDQQNAKKMGFSAY